MKDINSNDLIHLTPLQLPSSGAQWQAQFDSQSLMMHTSSRQDASSSDRTH